MREKERETTRWKQLMHVVYRSSQLTLAKAVNLLLSYSRSCFFTLQEIHLCLKIIDFCVPSLSIFATQLDFNLESEVAFGDDLPNQVMKCHTSIPRCISKIY